VLNVVIQRTVECGGHTTRYHNPIREPILCTFTTDLWGPAKRLRRHGATPTSLMRIWSRVIYQLGIHDALLDSPFTWMFEQ